MAIVLAFCGFFFIAGLLLALAGHHTLPVREDRLNRYRRAEGRPPSNDVSADDEEYEHQSYGGSE